MSKATFTPLGGAGEIGANSYRLGLNGHDLVLDCGMHPKKEGFAQLPQLDLLERAPSALVVSHAHIDHVGAVPYCLKRFPETPCYVTKPTQRIMERMLHNSVSVMKILGKEKHIREYPLYQHNDVDVAMRNVIGFDFFRTFQPTSGIDAEITFIPSGHVLGAASTLIRTEHFNFMYTGDVLTRDQELLGAMHVLEEDLQLDALVIEATRGASDDSDRRSFDAEIRAFGREIAKVIDNNGVVLAPAFALGRTQEILNILVRLRDNGLIPDVPIYASGLGRAVYEVYARYAHLLRPEAALVPLVEFERIGDVWQHDVRRELLMEPCIIVATSGMMVENTPSAMLAQDIVREKRHGLFFTGYVDPDTLGYQVLHAEPGQKLAFERDGKPIEVKLENIQRFHFSAHAGRDDLLRVIEHYKPKKVVFVHGDKPAIDWMQENCNVAFPSHSPAIGETITLAE